MRVWCFVVVGFCAACPAPPVIDGCPDVDALCPGLSCVERRQNADGCPTCECAVQACLIDEDCEARSPPQRCSVTPDICEPPPGCTDDDDSSGCAAACFGRCVEFGDVGGGAFCVGDNDCASFDGACRFDDRFCLIDPQRPGLCSGWCVAGCNDVETIALDPRSGQCFDFKDSCLPPDFREGC